jgi:hypothetical protein
MALSEGMKENCGRLGGKTNKGLARPVVIVREMTAMTVAAHATRFGRTPRDVATGE